MERKFVLYGVTGFVVGAAIATAVFLPFAGRGGESHYMASIYELGALEGDAFDRAFLENMIAHHEDGVAMAKLVGRGEHQQLQQLARDVISVQESEVRQMEQWMYDWGYVDVEPEADAPIDTEPDDAPAESPDKDNDTDSGTEEEAPLHGHTQ